MPYLARQQPGLLNMQRMPEGKSEAVSIGKCGLRHMLTCISGQCLMEHYQAVADPQ
jgi:hypothetical protein